MAETAVDVLHLLGGLPSTLKGELQVRPGALDEGFASER